MFRQVGMELPPLTLAIIKFADAFKHPLTWVLIASIVGGCYYLLRLLQRGGSDVPGGARLTVDLLAPMSRCSDPSFTRAWALGCFTRWPSMLEAGLNLVDILRLLDELVGNACLRHGLRETRQSLTEGQMFVESLTKHQVFSDGALQMLRAGEESGKLDEMMKLVALTYEQDLDLSLDRLGATLEPLIMSGMGVVVGLICIASLLPVLKFVQQI